ncbi:hypothetical protein BBJ29_001503 [Phytophthora kernoviae]|uniref:Uncharacterized protein n=1 Tax=Phytophthora kernoviae TaxID=325452 RepID=A0A3F2S1U8_9STRA|nr:hypothetical protein BBJ29_001503 [Phytophthora kernoviae]RLN68634.1 hypothetical protein BBP00_00000874 [Phytophthora kernoviae]
MPKSMWSLLRSQLGRKDLWFFGWISTINAFIGGAIPNIIYKNNDGDDGTGDFRGIRFCASLCSFLLGLLDYAFTPCVQNGLGGDYLVVLLIMAAPVLVMYFCVGLIRNNMPPKSEDAGGEKCEELEVVKPSIS